MSEDSHCKDCCCAKSWEALCITEYTGKSIPEHIAELREWRSIETAPDNELVLLYSPSAENRLSRIEIGYAAHGFKRNSLGVSNMSFHAFATHWMPLPAPPKK